MTGAFYSITFYTLMLLNYIVCKKCLTCNTVNITKNIVTITPQAATAMAVRNTIGDDDLTLGAKLSFDGIPLSTDA